MHESDGDDATSGDYVVDGGGGVEAVECGPGVGGGFDDGEDDGRAPTATAADRPGMGGHESAELTAMYKHAAVEFST